MVKKKIDPVAMSPGEIIKLFSQGLSIDMLAKRITLQEGIGRCQAKARAMDVVYQYQLAQQRDDKKSDKKV